MKKLLPLCALTFVTAYAGELKQAHFNADDWQEGEPPKEVFVVDGSVKVLAHEGNKALAVLPDPLTDASAQLGSSAAGESVIQVKVLGSKQGRSFPRFGVSVHGMSGHRLILNLPKRQLELMKNDEVLASVPYTWTTDTWVWIKLEARRGEGDAWSITGSAWAADAPEPKEPLIQHADKGLKGQGKPSIWGTPFSEKPIFFDDITVSVEAPAP